MNSFDIPWDLSQPTTFSQLADDDFLALLQKQFPATNGGLNVAGYNANAGTNAVNPQNLSSLQFSGASPSSADTTPSPPSATSANRRAKSNSLDLDDDGGAHDSALKRKASDDDFEDGQGSSKKGSRKRTSSGGDKDDNRLQKRKEQNRAAQRAFRERKERHVKDLEDKVSELETKNETQHSENENLRDLLQRLQSENMALKAQQASFTFSVPKPNSNGSSSASFNGDSFSPDNMMFNRSPSFSSPSSSSSPSNPLDFSSLQAFDPNVLNLLDEPPQQTATSSAMNMDFGFEGGGGDSSKNTFLNNYTVIANNPQFLSLSSMFDANPSPVPPPQQISPPQQQSTPDTNAFNFDMSGLTSWPRDSSGAGGLDEFFGSFMNTSMDLGGFGGTPGSTEGSSAISPIVHHQAPNGLFSMSNPSPTSASSPESQKSDSIFTPHESSASESEVEMDHGDSQDCPRTRGEMIEKVNMAGPSPFTSPPPIASSSNSAADDSCEIGGSGLAANLARKKGGDGGHVACQTGSTFPRTDKNPENIEVLNAWKKITAAPGFKEADINELCTEFSKKARCDGTHVVLEPSGVDDILQTMQHKNSHSGPGAMTM